MILEQINMKLDQMLAIHQALPTWIPLSKNTPMNVDIKRLMDLESGAITTCLQRSLAKR